MKPTGIRFFALAMAFSASGAAFAEGGLSVGVLAGVADQTTETEGGRDYEGDDASLGLRVAYGFNPYVALELAYSDFGEYEETYNPVSTVIVTDKFSTDAFLLGARVIWPVNDVFSLHARAGAARWTLELENDASSRTSPFTDDESGVSPYYGIGGDAALGEHWSLSLEYTVMNFDADLGTNSVEHDLKNASLAFGYRF